MNTGTIIIIIVHDFIMDFIWALPPFILIIGDGSLVSRELLLLLRDPKCHPQCTKGKLPTASSSESSPLSNKSNQEVPKLQPFEGTLQLQPINNVKVSCASLVVQFLVINSENLQALLVRPSCQGPYIPWTPCIQTYLVGT